MTVPLIWRKTEAKVNLRRIGMEAIKEHTYQIGEVARKYHLSVATLRYYDQEGLIPGLGKSASGCASSPTKTSAP